MLHLYSEIIYRPILNVLVFLYNVIPGHDVGLAIIAVTILVRIILAPFMHRSLKSQQYMTALQPKMNELREQHKDNKEAQAKAIMALYKEHKINPLASCLPLIIQLPILIALYQVLAKALKGNLDGLYTFIHNPGLLNPKMFGLIDLSQPNFLFAIAAGLAQFWQSRLMTASNAPSKDPTAKMMNIQVTYVLPLISVFIAWRLPAGLPLYWTVTTLLLVFQQKFVSKADLTGISTIDTTATVVKNKMTDYDKAEQVKQLIQDLLTRAGFQVRVEYEDSLLKGLVFNINSRESRSLIGRQGMTLHSLEILAHALAARHFKGEVFRFSLDVDDYKRKREWSLKELAKEAVESLKRTGKPVTLEPMPNYERRIIHSYLQEAYPHVTSTSQGVDPNRKIVLSLD